jgi:protein-S-isoprenylcysteine O-methyltransferase Ste14
MDLPPLANIAKIVAAIVLISWSFFGSHLNRRALTRRPPSLRIVGGWWRWLPDLIFVALLVLSALAILDAGTYPGRGVVFDLLRVIGLTIVACSIYLALWAWRSLGRNYALPIQTWDEQSLVTTGAYRVIRHPLYVAMVGFWLGLGLALMSWLLLFGLIVVVPVQYLRARKEEQVLAEYFQDEFRQYQRSVGMFIPRDR